MTTQLADELQEEIDWPNLGTISIPIDRVKRIITALRRQDFENARLRAALQWIVDMKDDCYPEEVAAKALLERS